jgi:predicted DNA-binding transcriptional regulator YafY
VARNSELIRQWEVLRAIDGARTGITVSKLAAERGVHPRTIRRDLEALCQAGFPLYDEKINGTSMWKLRSRPFQRLEESSLGLAELAALYFGRSMLSALAGPPFLNDAERALMKLERVIPAAARHAVDRLPRILNAKGAGRKYQDDRRLRDIVARAFHAALHHRRVTMRYASASSARTKEHTVEPHRLWYADGGTYLIAWVPEYGELRTFAMERIETLAVEDERFEPHPVPTEPFSRSLGAFTGPAEAVAVEFAPQAAPYVRSREWHRSQEIEDRGDGSIVLRLDVSIDPPLRRWILGFGSLARVLAPASLAQEILNEIQQAREQYAPRLEMARARAS